MNLLLIDFNTPDKQFIIDNTLSNTKCIEINSLTDTFCEIEMKIQQELYFQKFENIAIIRINEELFFNIPIHNLTITDSQAEIINFKDFLLYLKNIHKMQYFDIITCNAYDLNWQQFITLFKNNYNLTIRTSSNITGLGGDWILESDNINLVGLYFNENINNYKNSLDYGNHTVVVDSSFQLLACGRNGVGQLGINNTIQSNVLINMNTTNISSLNPIQIAYSLSHTVVLMSDNSIYTCGWNANGELGIGNNIQSNILVKMSSIPSGKIPIQVACGSTYTVVLMSDGTIYSCGINGSGQFGIGSTGGISNILIEMTSIPSGKKPIQIDCGYNYLIVLMSDNSVYGCGNNWAGQLGINTTTNTNILLEMTSIPSTDDEVYPTKVICGSSHTVVLMSDGSLYSCGDNVYGQLGINSITYSKNLIKMIYNTTIPAEVKPIQVSCGSSHTIVLLSDGSLYGCGDNSYGQLGIGNNINSKILVKMTSVPYAKKVIQVSCGGYHTVVLMSDLSVYCCGANGSSQLGINNTINSNILRQMINTRPILFIKKIDKPIIYSLDISLVSVLGGRTISIIGNYFTNNSIVKLDNSLVSSTFISPNKITFISPKNNSGTSIITISNNFGISNEISIQYIQYFISNICFPAGTFIQLDQGIISIEKINPNIHTIRKNKIQTITKTISQDKYLVCIEKNAIAKNIPNKKTLISKNHKLFYNGKMIQSKELLQINNERIYKTRYSGEILYNILLEKYDKMIVNNLICETLDPKNGIAKMYYDLKNSNYNFEKEQEFTKKYNEYVIKNKTFSK